MRCDHVWLSILLAFAPVRNYRDEKPTQDEVLGYGKAPTSAQQHPLCPSVPTMVTNSTPRYGKCTVAAERSCQNAPEIFFAFAFCPVILVEIKKGGDSLPRDILAHSGDRSGDIQKGHVEAKVVRNQPDCEPVESFRAERFARVVAPWVPRQHARAHFAKEIILAFEEAFGDARSRCAGVRVEIDLPDLCTEGQARRRLAITAALEFSEHFLGERIGIGQTYGPFAG